MAAREQAGAAPGAAPDAAALMGADVDAASAVRIAAEAKTKVTHGGARAACKLSVLEIVCMARVLDALLIDAFPAPRWSARRAAGRAAKPVEEL